MVSLSFSSGAWKRDPLSQAMLASEARGCHFVRGFQLHKAELSQQCQHMPPLGLFRMSFVGSFSSGSEFIHADHFHPFDIA